MHDLRCERSMSPASRCRCKECGGRRHGIKEPVYPDPAPEQAPGVLDHDPVPPASNLGIHHWFEAWVTA